MKPFASFGFLTVITTRNLSNSGFASIEVTGPKHGMGDPILILLPGDEKSQFLPTKLHDIPKLATK